MDDDEEHEEHEEQAATKDEQSKNLDKVSDRPLRGTRDWPR